jgi:hypothetical protein
VKFNIHVANKFWITGFMGEIDPNEQTVNATLFNAGASDIVITG